MQAIVLAAGIGMRLRPLTNSIPKCMVEVNGTPILVNTLDQLSKFGIHEAIIVVGHKRDVITGIIGQYHNGMRVRYVVNDIYDKTNNIYSLWLAAGSIAEDVLLVEGDVFFEEAMLEEALKDRNKNVVLLAEYEPHMDGTLVEIGRDGCVSRMIPKSEQGDSFDYSGVYKTINMYHFTRDFFESILVPNLDTYIKTQSMNEYYELVLRVIAFIGRPKLHAKVVHNIKWYEIDDQSDLEAAEYMFSSPSMRMDVIQSRHGGYWHYDFIDYCYLYNPYFPTKRMYTELGLMLPKLVGNYPSGLTRMRTLLSRWINVPYQHVVVGNGSSELIRLINRNLVRKMTIPVPSFNEYENTLRRDQINLHHLSHDDFEIHPDRFIESVRESESNAALIVNPNNPTSLYLDKDKLRFILNQLEDLDLIVVDESFVDFVDGGASGSIQEAYAEFDNVLILKSLSKAYGVPGLRLGYVLSKNSTYVEALSSEVPIWNINPFAEWFLEIFPRHLQEFRLSCRRVMADRRDLFEQLNAARHLRLYEPSANFVFARISNGKSSTALRDALFAKHNMLIKDCSSKSGLSDGQYIRIAVRTQEENRQLVKALVDELA